MTKIYPGGDSKWWWQSLLSYITQNLFPFVSFDNEGIVNVFIKTVLPWFLIFTMIDSKFHFSPTFTSNLFFWTRNKNDICLKHDIIHPPNCNAFLSQRYFVSLLHWQTLNYCSYSRYDNQPQNSQNQITLNIIQKIVCQFTSLLTEHFDSN